jgi:hypothetical protein
VLVLSSFKVVVGSIIHLFKRDNMCNVLTVGIVVIKD